MLSILFMHVSTELSGFQSNMRTYVMVKRAAPPPVVDPDRCSSAIRPNAHSCAQPHFHILAMHEIFKGKEDFNEIVVRGGAHELLRARNATLSGGARGHRRADTVQHFVLEGVIYGKSYTAVVGGGVVVEHDVLREICTHHGLNVRSHAKELLQTRNGCSGTARVSFSH